MSRVKDRFGGGLASVPCRYAVSHLDKMASTRPGTRDAVGQSIVDLAEYFSYGLNNSMVYVRSLGSGNRESSGNFSGFIGVLQRDEADLALSAVRPHSLTGEPVLLHSGHSQPFDAMFFSTTKDKQQMSLDILDSTKNVSIVAYAQCVTMLFIVAAMMALPLTYFAISTMTSQRFLKRFRKSLICAICQIVMAVLNQCQLNAIKTSTRIIWFITTSAILVLVTGFFWNLMSVDMVAEVKPKQIDSVEDIFSPEFKHVLFHMTTNLFLYEVLKEAPPGSILRKLFNRINVKFKFDFVNSGGPEALNTIETSHGNEMTSAAWSFMYELGYETIFCHVKPAYLKKYHKSKDRFAESYMTSMFNKKMSYKLREYSAYRIYNSVEMGLMGRQIKNVVLSGVTQLFMTNWNATKCMFHLEDIPGPRLPQLEFRGLRKTLTISIVLIMLSLNVICFELFYGCSYGRYCKRQYRRIIKIFK